MAFNPNIKYNPSLSAEDNFKVLFNWLNFALREMTVGRVPQTKEEADKTADRVASNEEVNNITFVALAETKVLDDDTAARHAEAFPLWEVGVEYKKDNQKLPMRVDPLNGKLYRLNEGHEHTSVEGWNPSLTPAMWTVVDVTHAGTMEDPISAARSMEYTYGLYYYDSEDGNLYLCKRMGEADGGKVTLHFMPHELVGQYFELA